MITDNKSLEFNSLEIACAAVAVGREKVKLKFKWPKRLEEVLSIRFEEFKNCYKTVKR